MNTEKAYKAGLSITQATTDIVNVLENYYEIISKYEDEYINFLKDAGDDTRQWAYQIELVGRILFNASKNYLECLSQIVVLAKMLEQIDGVEEM